MLSSNLEALNEKLKQAYRNAHVLTAKGSKYEMEDFMAGKTKVNVTITEIHEG